MANIKEAPLVSNTANRMTPRGQEHRKQDISLYAPQGQDGQGFQGLFHPTTSTDWRSLPIKTHTEFYGALCPSLIIRKAILASALATAVEEFLQNSLSPLATDKHNDTALPKFKCSLENML